MLHTLPTVPALRDENEHEPPRNVNGLFSRSRKINIIGRWARTTSNSTMSEYRPAGIIPSFCLPSSVFGLSSFKLQPTPTSISHTLSRKLSGQAKSPEDALLHLDSLELQPVSLLQPSEGPNRHPQKTLDIRHRAH